MLSNWLSWSQQKNELQLQEPFNDQYEATDEEGGWIKVNHPGSMKRLTELHESQPTKLKKDISQVQLELDQKKTTELTELVAKLQEESKKTQDSVEVTQVPLDLKMTQDKPVIEEQERGKKLSRQEKRAKERLAARELKKQARNAAMAININRGKGLSPSCLPTTTLMS